MEDQPKPATRGEKIAGWIVVAVLLTAFTPAAPFIAATWLKAWNEGVRELRAAWAETR